MNADAEGSRRWRISIGAVMLWIAGIALVLGILRTTQGRAVLALLGGAVALVVTPLLSYRGVHWLDRRLIQSRPEASSSWERAIEIGLSFAWNVFIVVVTCAFGIVVVLLGFKALSWGIGGVR